MAWTQKPLIWGESPLGSRIEEMSRFHLPAGTVTFMLTDIEGSTGLWARFPDAMAAAVADSYAILAGAIAEHDGVRPIEQGEGDSVVGAFSRASDALAAALQAQLELRSAARSDALDLRVRIALHTADAQLRDEGNYFGLALSRCARLRSIARGGQTLLSRTTRDLIVDRLPDDVDLIDCGVHRLPDLGRPENVFALMHPGLDGNLGALRSLDTFVNNLPDQLTTFVGRGEELAQLRRAIGETRLLTLTGAGGAGKTRLALQLAADLLERFPDGVWWVDLAPVSDPQLVGEMLAGVLGVRPLPGITMLEACANHLASGQALVALDNCEHLLSGCAEVAEGLLHACSELVVIATSRTPLGVPSETDWRVPPLSLPPAERRRDTFEAVGQFDAVRLFIERARKARPNFTVTNDNAPAVAEICQELDGLPLAIELAAARVRMMSVEQIADGLGDRFHLLTGGTRTVLPRHQTLRASVDWSHELLGDAERTLLRRVSVFAGGFTLDLGEAVCADQSLERVAVLDVLTSLVDKSLVVAEERPSVVRYRLLETVRQYALERLLDAGEADSVRDRHRDAMLELAETTAPKLHGPGQREWLEVLDGEAANLTVALDHAAATDGEQALRLAVALTFWWRLRGLLRAGERGFTRALDAADPAPSSLRAYALWGGGFLAAFMGDFAAALARFEDARAVAEEVGDSAALAHALGGQAFLRLLPDPAGARQLQERVYRLAQASGDLWDMMYSKLNIGWSHILCGHPDVGEPELEDAVPLIEQLNSYEGWAWYWAGKSIKHFWAANAELFRECAGRARNAAREVGEPVTEATADTLMARMEIAQGDPAAAIERLEASRARAIAAGAGWVLPRIDIGIAEARAELGDLPTARSVLETIVASGGDFGYSLGLATAELTNVLLIAGDLTAAEARAKETLAIGERIQTAVIVGLANEQLARLALARDEPGHAEELLHQALGAHLEYGAMRYLPQTFDCLAETAARLDSGQEAARLLGAAHRLREDLGLVRSRHDEPWTAALERTLREQLGDAGFGDAHQEGAALSLAEALTWMRHARGERKRPARGWESLTPTELRVVELIAEGLTNPQIGQRMFISRGTVKVHLSHIFAKLSMASRAELAAEATRRELSANP
jgi:predicted ATPase/class 3 adenylate cyclase/DNA-binding CsgD family transcriptional regulator